MAREPVDYYAVLQVNPSATLPVIEAAYRTARANDGSHDPLLDEAFQVLTDVDLRSSYDVWYQSWAVNPELVAAEARRRSRRQAVQRASMAAGRLGRKASRQGTKLRQQAGRAAQDTGTRLSHRLRVLRTQREAQKARAQEFKRVPRYLTLHPFRALFAIILLLAVSVAAIAIPLQISRDRTERAAAAEAAAIAQAETERAAQEAERLAAQKAEEDAAAEAQRQEAAEKRRADQEKAAAAHAERQEEERKALAAKRRACVEDLRGGETDLEGCVLTDLDLARMDLSGRNLGSVDFGGSDLTDAIFDDSDLTNATWAGATCPDGTEAYRSKNCQDHLLLAGEDGRPLHVGDSTRIGDWTVTVTSYQADQQSSSRAVDNYNTPPGEGFVYAIIGISATYEGQGQNESAGSSLDFAINDIQDHDPDTFCSLSTLDGKFDLLNTGHSASFENCLYLPLEEATSGHIRVYAGYSFDDESPSAIWAIP